MSLSEVARLRRSRLVEDGGYSRKTWNRTSTEVMTMPRFDGTGIMIGLLIALLIGWEWDDR